MPDKTSKSGPFDFKINYNPDFILEKYHISDEAAAQMDEIFPEAIKGKKSAIKKLHRLRNKYPHIPQFKNYLAAAYRSSNNHQKAVEVNDELLQKHPNYLFGALQKAEALLENDQLDEVPDFLGDDLHIHKLYPDRDTFHIGEVSKYYSVAVQYLLKMGRVEEAKLRLDYLTKIEPDAPETELAMLSFMQYNIKTKMQQREKEKLIERKVESRSYHKDLQTDQAPSFTHHEIGELYKHGFDIPEEIIHTILKLPRETLITDLEHVLEDSIYRYQYFYDEDGDRGWDESRYNFSIHAIFLLTELRSKKSLDKLFNILRQADEIREFWYGDLLEEVFSESVAILAADNLEAITNFVKEPRLDAYSRNVGLSALELTALSNPEYRDEVIKHFDDLIQYHLSQLDNDDIIDTTLLSFLVWSCINISAVELIPSIRKLFENDLIQQTMVGDLKSVEKDIEGKMVSRGKHPKTIFEKYKNLNFDAIRSDLTNPESPIDNSGNVNPFSESREADIPALAQPFHSRFEPETNPYKNVGRNDPCPCGSGKKFKKCCL